MNGMWFDDIHSYEDLNLVLSAVYIPPAVAKTNYIEIPGGDGTVDLTEAFGEVKYNDRECSFTFTVFPGDDFEEKKREVSNRLNGKRCKITLDKDPEFYWDGRCFLDDYATDRNLLQIVVRAIVRPYKMKQVETKAVFPAGEATTKRLLNGRKTVIPTITNTATADIVFGGQTYTIKAGTHRLLNIELVEGENVVMVTSSKEVLFAYREGDL